MIALRFKIFVKYLLWKYKCMCIKVCTTLWCLICCMRFQSTQWQFVMIKLWLNEIFRLIAQRNLSKHWSGLHKQTQTYQFPSLLPFVFSSIIHTLVLVLVSNTFNKTDNRITVTDYSEIWVNIAGQTALLPAKENWLGVEKNLQEQLKTERFEICLLFRNSCQDISVNFLRCGCL